MYWIRKRYEWHILIFHSIVRYGNIFRGNSSDSYKVFKCIMPGAEPRASWRGLFRRLEILPIPCQYILSLMLFILNYPNNFQAVSEVHGPHTRSKNQLFISNTNLTSVENVIKLLCLEKMIKKTPFCIFSGYKLL